MRTNVLAMFPDDWKTEVVVIPRMGRDRFGNPAPDGEPYVLTGCVIGAGGVAGDNRRWEGRNESDATDTTLHLYAPPGSVVRARDIVMVPPTHLNSGTMAVDGDPVFWPFGLDASLRRTDGSGEVPYNWLREREEVLPGWLFAVIE